jgi:small subunit ribosomal protein S4
LCRREGTKLFLKGERCFSDKCAVARRGQAPGQHGAAGGRKRTKEYGLQLREKQKAKRYYGILEKQFKTYFVKADKKPGQTGENLLTTIERRLDNVVYRMGMAESRREARQLVIHGHFRVNGKKVDIPSVILKKGDVITLREASRKSEKIKMLIENISARQVPAWIDMDKENIQATISELPTRADVDFPIEEHLIVELYSK